MPKWMNLLAIVLLSIGLVGNAATGSLSLWKFIFDFSLIIANIAIIILLDDQR